jgi:hypothetical protein
VKHRLLYQIGIFGNFTLVSNFNRPNKEILFFSHLIQRVGMRTFFAGPPICIVVVILLLISPDSSLADLCEYFETQGSAQTAMPGDLPSAIILPFAVETTIPPEIHETQSGLVGIPVMDPATGENPIGESNVEYVVFIQNLSLNSDAPEKIAAQSAMPIFGNNDRQIALQPFHIVSYETVDQEFNKNFWETTNLDFLESQIGDLMLDAGFDNRAAGTVHRSSSSTPGNSTGPMIWVFLGLIAITAACLRRV